MKTALLKRFSLSIPLKQALEVICEKLEADETLPDRTDWKVEDILKLLEISM